MKNKKFFVLVLFTVFLFSVGKVYSLPLLNISGGASSVFDHDDYALIPDGETRAGYTISNAHQGSITTNFFADLFFNPLYSQGIGGFSFGDKSVNVFANNQLALRGIDTAEKSLYLIAGTEIKIGIYEYFLPLINVSNLINHPTATMDVVLLDDQNYLVDIATNGTDTNFLFTMSSGPSNLGTPIGTVAEPSILLLLGLGLLGIFYMRNIT